jgi:hypothetical protein
MSYFDNKQKRLTESFQYEDILKLSLSDFYGMNGGDIEKTLIELNSFMSNVQGSDDTKERKAYFKAKKIYEKLVNHINKDKGN